MDWGYLSLEYIPWIRSGLRLVHFAGIILGVGAATLLDLIIFRFVLTRHIEENSIRIVSFSSSIIVIGLILLWASGIGFFVDYWFYDSTKIMNPKLFAKIIIVAALTANAFMVHYYVLPQIAVQIGKRLFDGLTTLHRFLLILIGTISAISWYVPLVLGIVPQFNNTIPADVFIISYIVLIFSINIVIQIVMVTMQHGRHITWSGSYFVFLVKWFWWRIRSMNLSVPDAWVICTLFVCVTALIMYFTMSKS